jgi:outer membrane receptor protein involved in Fe transport
MHYKATTPYTFTDFYDPMKLDVVSLSDAGVTMGGLFAENEMPLAKDKLKWTLGVRGDYANVFEGQLDPKTGEAPRDEHFLVFNGTTGAKYQYAKNNYISLNVARSCRMPDVTELFVETTTNDAHVFGNADLAPEYGLGVDFGLRGKVEKTFRYDLTLYSNFLREFISLKHKEGSGMPGYAYQHVNIPRTHIYGGELSLGYSINGLFGKKDTWQYGSYYVITKGYEIDEGDAWTEHSEPLINIQPFNTRQELTCRYRFNEKLSGFLGANFLYFARRTEYPADSYETGRYTLLGGKAGMRYHADNGIGYNLSLVSTNLTDERYCAFESIVYGMGRNIKLMFNIEFGSKRRKYFAKIQGANQYINELTH